MTNWILDMALRGGGCIGTLLCGEEGSGAHKHSGFVESIVFVAHVSIIIKV